jgi:hypothetical protein
MTAQEAIAIAEEEAEKEPVTSKSQSKIRQRITRNGDCPSHDNRRTINV